MLTKKLGSRLGRLDEKGAELIAGLQQAKEGIIADFEELNYAAAVRTIAGLADQCNRYFDQAQPWVTIKTDAEATRTTLTAVINAVKILTIYLKAILPGYAEKVERFLNTGPLDFEDVDSVLQEHEINKFERLVERVEKEKVEAMVEESKEEVTEGAAAQAGLEEPIEPECTIEDFMKVDLRIAKVVVAEPVEGADRLLHLELDIGGIKKSVFAGIAKAYKCEELVGKTVVCVANLKPRQMKFGLSEGMILASGLGDKDIFMLTADEGAVPGQRVH
jgi:methionyl-tRNA synthetase